MDPSRHNSIHPSTHDRTLVVMAKAPRPGMVKTRLTPGIPVAAVTELYRCLLDDTIALAQSLRCVDVAIMCPREDVADLKQLARGVVDVVAQNGQGLASGLTSVFEHFAASGRQSVIAFNSDSPHLPASTLTSAFDLLENHDVVVGPTHDGGYYLVGARVAYPALFAGDGMGTASALDRLLASTQALKLSVGFTEPFYDVDVQEDLRRLDAELRAAPDRAPRTAGWLRQWAATAAQSRALAENL